MDKPPSAGRDHLRRSLELLWGVQEPGRRGPRPRHSADEVVAAAIAIADAEGVQGLSMRRVAEVVGMSPMALYTYVASKGELLDLMVDRVLGETPDPPEDLPGWRQKLSFIARGRWDAGERHPWLLDLPLQRPPLGPNVIRKAEMTLRALEGTGLAFRDMALVADALDNYVTGALQAARAAREAERETGLTDAEWQATAQELMEGRLDPEAFPAILRWRDAKAAAERPAERFARFEFGLACLLDGLESRIGAQEP